MKNFQSINLYRSLRLSALTISMASHLFSAILFSLFYKNMELGRTFLFQYYPLLILSAVAGLTLFVIKDTVSIIVLLILKSFFLFLIGYPMGSYIGIELILYTSLILEISFYLNPPGSLIIHIIVFASFISTQGSVSAWQHTIKGVSAHDLLSSALFGIIVIAISMMLKQSEEKNSVKTRQIKHLNSAISQLTDANIGFQSYTKNLEMQTLIEERKRVSREIHDTVGYALTNIIIMMEAAMLLTDRQKAKRNNLLSTSREQAKKGLEETRTALRHLRNEKIAGAYGINMIQELVSAFKQATGTDIKVEYGNLSGFTNERIDAIVFRIIQEGLTNALRHGMATVIRINFWITDERLSLSIYDNGIGSGEIVEGIGVAGMRERISAIGGIIDIRNVVDGFKISVEIPLEQ